MKCDMEFDKVAVMNKNVFVQVSVLVQDKDARVRWLMQGTWDTHMDCMKVTNTQNANAQKPVLETERPKRIWQKNPLLLVSFLFCIYCSYSSIYRSYPIRYT